MNPTKAEADGREVSAQKPPPDPTVGAFLRIVSLLNRCQVMPTLFTIEEAPVCRPAESWVPPSSLQEEARPPPIAHTSTDLLLSLGAAGSFLIYIL